MMTTLSTSAIETVSWGPCGNYVVGHAGFTLEQPSEKGCMTYLTCQLMNLVLQQDLPAVVTE
ncbi:hypothetical protein BN2475_170033 [Paraburkholderia ribeironis]|uniref:Uncharacterized protein n=1 Tax=Paraburkholderia ribeironis TaxID=1247936 RepID=A0A1N7RUH8_9BURK|nr:hypothetical protein BN2475_170033 [Paraburkholderia ribeironis]